MIVFLDFETTGLDPDAGAEPIELAAVIADDSFSERAAFETLILPAQTWEHWDPAAHSMHAASGLARECFRRGRSRVQAGNAFATFLALNTSGPLHLAGNSVHFDRMFLRRYFPAIERLFHHRHLDVSSVRMLAERAVPGAPQLHGEKPHRAMPDVRRSIAELHHWTAVLRGGA